MHGTNATGGNEPQRSAGIVLSSTDRGCPLCQNTRPCGYMNPSLLEPPREDIFDDAEEKDSCCSAELAGSASSSVAHTGKEVSSCCDVKSSCCKSERKEHRTTCKSKSPCQKNMKSKGSSCCSSWPSSPSKTKKSQQREKRFRCYQTKQWMQKYMELINFRQKFGHSCVPSRCKENPSLGLWVKRQRNQYSAYQKEKGRSSCGCSSHKCSQDVKAGNSTSALTPDRIDMLEQLDFVWNFRDALWLERYNDLKQFVLKFGNANVPSVYEVNQPLAAWVKCQRHQQQLRQDGRPSTMTSERKGKLDGLGFQWRILGSQD